MNSFPVDGMGDSPVWADVVEMSPVPTLVLAADRAAGVACGQITYANAAARSVFGDETSGELAFASVFDLIDEDFRNTVAELLAQAAAKSPDGDLTASRQVALNRIAGDDVLHDEVDDVHGRAATLQLRAGHHGNVIAQVVHCDGWRAVDRVVTEQRRFRGALMELSELSHTTRNDENFYQRLIERAVEVVPGAQGGSVQLKIPGTNAFRFVAAVGYDLAGLQEHVLEQRHFFRDTWDPNARVLHDFENKGRTPEIREWLQTTGRLSEIVVNVSGPVLYEGYPVAFLSLDNFEDASAMTETSVEMTTVLSRLIGELWRRRELEAEVHREREAFRHLALHDPLTGLANRRNLERSMTEAMTAARRRERASSVLFVDIDDFKGVNDRLGHEIGDRLLTCVAAGLNEAVRTGDIVGRWGGDEFLILPHRLVTSEEAMDLAERVLNRFETDIDLGAGMMYRARLTVGVGWSEDSHIDVDGLVRAADEALYEAKAAGKGIARLGYAKSQLRPIASDEGLTP